MLVAVTTTSEEVAVMRCGAWEAWAGGGGREV